MQPVTTEWLQSIPDLQHVPVNQLQWLLDESRQYQLKEGEYLFRTNNEITGTHILVEGKIRIYIEQNQGQRELGILEPKEITGHLPFSRGKISAGTGMVIEDATIITFPKEKSRDLIVQHFELTQALVHMMTDRVREFTALQQQNEKMMALGKLSAGLAHELNNPAAAIVRGSNSLKKHLQLQPESFKKVIAINMSAEQVDQVNNCMFSVLRKGATGPLSLMERTEKEDELNDWLDANDIDSNNDLAENFVDFGFTVEDLDGFKSIIPVKDLAPVLNWINNNLVTEKMVNDIEEASQRISDLVKSVKNFTHMDRGGDREFCDVHFGIRNTVNMLGYRLKKGNVELIEDYDSDLPPVHAYMGELNQVWTNLVDNALDAMEPAGSGKLEITTKRDGAFVQVAVTDNGPGIPAEIQSRIFDPFYTTKDIGKGTGLGLDVVKRIVDQHNGSVSVKSLPGRTTFTICFPIQ